MNYNFSVEDYSLEEIKNDCYLHDLFIDGSSQLENVAATIQSLYFYGAAVASHQCPKSLEASLCRTLTIMSYSIVEAIVLSVAFKIQDKCQSCKHPCANRSSTVIDAPKEKRFWEADEFLKKHKIIYFADKDINKFYEDFRLSRNNVHLMKKAEVLYKDPNYLPDKCQMAIKFLKVFIDTIHDNFRMYLNMNHC